MAADATRRFTEEEYREVVLPLMTEQAVAKLEESLGLPPGCVLTFEPSEVAFGLAVIGNHK